MSLAGLWCPMDWTYKLVFIFLQIGFTVSVSVAGKEKGNKCYKDEKLGDFYSFNIYYCSDAGRPSCCEIDYEATCCEEEGIRKLKEQMQLWGTLVAVAVVVAIIVICYRKDTHCCTGETSIIQRIKKCCGCEKKEKQDVVILDNINDEPTSSGNTPKKFTNPSKVSKPGHSYSQNGVRGPYHIDSDDYDSGRGSVISVTPPGGSPIGSPLSRGGGAAAYFNPNYQMDDTRGMEMTEKHEKKQKHKRKGKSGKRKKNKSKMFENDDEDISL